MRVLVVALVLLGLAAPAASAGRMPAPPHVWAHHHANPKCGDLACSSPPTGEIWLPDDTDRFAKAHEVGHVWFYAVPNDEQRAWFIRKLGLPITDQGGALVDGGWYRGTGDHGNDAPDERAADAYAACDLGRWPRARHARDGSMQLRWETAYDYYPTPRQYDRICTAITFLGLATRGS